MKEVFNNSRVLYEIKLIFNGKNNIYDYLKFCMELKNIDKSLFFDDLTSIENQFKFVGVGDKDGVNVNVGEEVVVEVQL